MSQQRIDHPLHGDDAAPAIIAILGVFLVLVTSIVILITRFSRHS